MNMALASVLKSDFGEFSYEKCQPLDFKGEMIHSDVGFESAPGESLSFTVRNPLCAAADDEVERKIEFLHGTTTLAFKVIGFSLNISEYVAILLGFLTTRLKLFSAPSDDHTYLSII